MNKNSLKKSKFTLLRKLLLLYKKDTRYRKKNYNTFLNEYLCEETYQKKYNK